MAKKQESKRVIQRVTKESLVTLDSLIPYRLSDTVTINSEKLGIAVLQKFFWSRVDRRTYLLRRRR